MKIIIVATTPFSVGRGSHFRILNESKIHVSDRNAELPIMTRRGDVCGEIHLGLVKGKWTIREIFLNRNGPEFMISLKTALEKSGFVVHLR